MQDLRAKIVLRCFITHGMVPYNMTIPDNGDESNDENMLGENGDAEVNPDDDKGHDSDYTQKKVLRR